MVWSSERTSPAEVEAALRAMLVEGHSAHAACIPARTLNLVCVVDAEAQEEIVARLHGLGGYHASRTIVCSVEPRRHDIGAVATLASDTHPRPGEFAVLHETVLLRVGERHVPHLESIVDPLVVAGLPTVIWSPHDHDEAVRALLGLGQVVLLDSVDDPSPSMAMRRARGWLQHARVIDLAWLRTTPWRERLAATFEPTPLRGDLDRISRVTVTHHADSAAAALLVIGWLATALGWRLRPLHRHQRRWDGRAEARQGEVRIVLEPAPRQRVQGLAGMTLDLGSGGSLSLDRAPGGLRAHHHDRTGMARTWTLLGASRGEAGILGDGIRQALLRDRIYDHALAAASMLAGES
jgi:glucose-6-phosphate dehydrogenase assembly protein OpcA